MVKIRLRRMGAKKNPYYRIVVADSKSPRDGRFIEEIGSYNPLTSPSEIKVNLERAQYWIKNGAQPTDTVKALIKKAGASGPVADASVPAAETGVPATEASDNELTAEAGDDIPAAEADDDASIG